MKDMQKKEIQMITVTQGELYPPPKDLEKMGYHSNQFFALPYKFETRFRVIVETLKEFTSNSNGGKTFEVCEELDHELKQLCQSLLYLINSTSYRRGQKYYNFDKMEIDSKLGRKK